MSSRPSFSVLCLRYLYLILVCCNIFLHKCNARSLGFLSKANPVTRVHFHKGNNALRLIDTTGVREKDENQSQDGFHKKAAPDVDTGRVAGMAYAKASVYGLESSIRRLAGFGGEKLASKNIVSWHLPGKTKSRKQQAAPGVYSDYPKPRPRPPTHN